MRVHRLDVNRTVLRPHRKSKSMALIADAIPAEVLREAKRSDAP